ncbi:MAG: hypothetical protein VB070_01780 [Clostridiaceae bacterium]|nr:hypothetical protein [Clostridiaceae bacterium]
MNLGKFGLSLSALAILAFIISFFSSTQTIGALLVLVLFLAYAAILEKDQWLTRQVLQAIYLNLAYLVAYTVISWIMTAILALFAQFNAYQAVSSIDQIFSVLKFLLLVAYFVFSLLAVLKLAKNQDAGVPMVGPLVDKTLGIFRPQAAPAAPVQPVAPAYQAPAAYQPQTAYQPQNTPITYPTPPAAPAAESSAPAPAAEAAPVQVPAPVQAPVPVQAQAAPGTWICSCGHENNGNFCMVCGHPRP